MRAVLLVVFALACKDKPTAETPKVGSASAVVAEPTPAPSTLRLPKLAGTPPAKGKPLDAAKAAQLSKHDIDGWTRDVRLADAKGLDLRYRSTTPPTLTVTVQASRCFDCLPMQHDRWLLKSDALRSLIAPELRDHKDTTWEMGMTTIGQTSYTWTHHIAYVVPPDANGLGAVFGTAYTVYFNDGINMIRVVAEYRDDAPVSREAMLRAAPRQDLEQVAKAFIDHFVHLWG